MKKVAPKRSPKEGNLSAAKKNIKVYLGLLEDTRSKFATWLDPSSKNKTIGMRLQKKFNPEKVVMLCALSFSWILRISKDKQIQLDKISKNDFIKAFSLIRKDFKQFVNDFNRYGKELGEREFQKNSLTLGTFKEELVAFRERLVKSETTHSVIDEVLALFQKVNEKNQQRQPPAFIRRSRRTLLRKSGTCLFGACSYYRFF